MPADIDANTEFICVMNESWPIDRWAWLFVGCNV